LITALSEGRGYGEAGGEGYFLRATNAESLTHYERAPLLVYVLCAARNENQERSTP